MSDVMPKSSGQLARLKLAMRLVMAGSVSNFPNENKRLIHMYYFNHLCMHNAKKVSTYQYE